MIYFKFSYADLRIQHAIGTSLLCADSTFNYIFQGSINFYLSLNWDNAVIKFGDNHPYFEIIDVGMWQLVLWILYACQTWVMYGKQSEGNSEKPNRADKSFLSFILFV